MFVSFFFVADGDADEADDSLLTALDVDVTDELSVPLCELQPANASRETASNPVIRKRHSFIVVPPVSRYSPAK